MTIGVATIRQAWAVACDPLIREWLSLSYLPLLILKYYAVYFMVRSKN